MREYSEPAGRVLDLSNMVFGKLTVLALKGVHRRNAYWECRCECGNLVDVKGESIRSGHTASCGCLQKEWASKPKTHGLTKHPLFKTWALMLQRCNNPKSKDYGNYGGRGIGVCDEWLNIHRFIADMGSKPPGKTLDRIDNNKGYDKDNCRWATYAEQCFNKRITLKFNVNGESLTLKDMAEKSGIPVDTIRLRISRGFDAERAMTQPLRKYPRGGADDKNA